MFKAKLVFLTMAVIALLASISFSALLGEPPEAAEKPSKTTKSNSEKTDTAKPIKRIDTMIAVFDLETTEGVSKSVSRPLSESIRREVFKSGKWELIDRGNMDKMLGEQKFQLSGCVTGQCIVEAGQMLGVGKIVAGTVSLIGKTYYLSLSLINAETGKIEAQSEDKCKCELDELIDSSKRLISKLIGETTGSPLKEPTQKTFSLEELEQNMKKDKAEWDKKTEQMKLAYNKVLEYEKKENISPEIKANAWKHFADSFKEDNPQSTEDDTMRKKAEAQIEHWQKAKEKSSPAYEYYSKGYDYEKNKDDDKAIEYYLKAVSIDQNYENALFGLGYVYNNKKEYDKAIEYYNRVLALNPRAKDALNNIGLAYEYQKDYVKAESYYRKSIAVDPSYGIAWESLGYALYYQMKDSEAKEAWKKAVSLGKTGAKDALKKYYNITD